MSGILSLSVSTFAIVSGQPSLSSNPFHVSGVAPINNKAIPDSDGDGINDYLDHCPNQPENFNGVLDGDGCPDNNTTSDTDRDGIADNVDSCPAKPETWNGFEDNLWLVWTVIKIIINSITIRIWDYFIINWSNIWTTICIFKHVVSFSLSWTLI